MVKADGDHKLLVLLFLLQFITNRLCLANVPYNITLNATQLAISNDLTVHVGDSVDVYCTGASQRSYDLYNVNKNTFNNCGVNTVNSIGSCVHSPLDINIRTLAIPLIGDVSYVAGNTYYYVVYDSDGDMTLPCENGLKLTIRVVEPDAGDSMVVSSSTAVPPQSLNTSSLMLMDMHTSSFITRPSEAPPNATTSPTTTGNRSTTIRRRPSSTTTITITTRGVRVTRSTTVTKQKSTTDAPVPTRPSIGRLSESNSNTVLYSGVGAGIGVLVLIVIIILIVIVAIVLIKKRNNRASAVVATYDSSQEKPGMMGTYTDVMNRYTPPPSADDPTKMTPFVVDQNCSNNLTINTQESITSSTSMEPLLNTPSSPTHKPELNSIIER